MMLAPHLESYLTKIRIPLRLGCMTPGGWPFVVSLWYVYRDGKLYCATQARARLVRYLEREPRCAFEIAADTPPYCGVRGTGRATLDPTQGPDLLLELMQRYLGGIDHNLGRYLMSRRDSEMAIIIEPQSLYEWDYTERMQGIPTPSGDKICP